MSQKNQEKEISPEHQEEVRERASLLKAISNPIRLCLVRQMYQHGPCNVSYFTSCMESSQSNISQHLARLRAMGIVDFKKEGQTVHYFIKDRTVEQLIKILFPEPERKTP